MKRALLLPFLILLVSGCVQDQPTGKFLVNHIASGECISSWNCTERTSSFSGVQNRICTDDNSCQAEAERPEESRICGLPGVSTVNLSEMMLSTVDLPINNWNKTVDRVLLKDNVTPNERGHGFIKGHQTFFASDDLIVKHTVSLYPMADSRINLTFDIGAAKTYYSPGKNYDNTNLRILAFSELESPLLGEDSIAYNVTVTDGNGKVETVYTVFFVKLDIASVVTIQGTSPDYPTLLSLAKKSESKIV